MIQIDILQGDDNVKLQIAVCDDNTVTLNNEFKLIKDVLNKKGMKYSAAKFNSPEHLLKSDENYDIVFLDIEMDYADGIETARQLKVKNKNCLVFFITNYWRYLDNAFDVHAFRFWKKPIDEVRLGKGIEAAIKELNNAKSLITVNVRGIETKILVRNIIYVYVENKITRIVSVNGELRTDDTYKSVCRNLEVSESFGEPYRGHYINFMYVQNYIDDTVICSYQNKRYEFNVSRRKRDGFNKLFYKWIGEKQ